VPPHRIKISLNEIGQLFNSMDPSPFIEKDLDKDAEEFILGWAHEYAHHEPVSLVIHLKQVPEDAGLQPMVQQAVRNYFAYRAKLNRLEFGRLMKQGRLSLAIGLVFLAGCLAAGELLAGGAGRLAPLLREGFLIMGWVAMWRPLEIYLYDWWPLRRRGRTLEKLSRIDVEVRRRE
jgi:hypothetical protein